MCGGLQAVASQAGPRVGMGAVQHLALQSQTQAQGRIPLQLPGVGVWYSPLQAARQQCVGQECDEAQLQALCSRAIDRAGLQPAPSKAEHADCEPHVPECNGAGLHSPHCGRQTHAPSEREHTLSRRLPSAQQQSWSLRACKGSHWVVSYPPCHQSHCS